MSAQLFTA